MQQQQWMLGPDVLVAPVVEPGATSREVYFPAGCWQHAETGEVFEGTRTATVDAPLASLPHFFRCGVDGFDGALQRLVGSPGQAPTHQALTDQATTVAARALPRTGGALVLPALVLLGAAVVLRRRRA